MNPVDLRSNNFLQAFEQLRTTGNSPLINQLLAGHSGLTLVSGVRETGSQFLLRQSLAGPVRLANGTQTSNLVAAGAVAQAAFIIAQSTQGTFSGKSGSTLIANGFSPFFFQPYPQFTGAVNVIDNGDRSRYHALEIQMSRRSSKGLAFQISYTLAKSQDTRSFDPAFTIITRGGGTGQSAGNTPLDINNRELNYARSDFYRRHALQGYVIYELPFGKGRRWGSGWSDTADFLLGGFNMAAVMRRYSGRPFTVFSGSNTLSQVVFTPASCNDCSPNLGSVTLENNQNVFFTSEQRAKFFVPAAGEASNVGRNFFTGPSFFNLDMTLGKKFAIGETKNIEIRVEAQNVTNTPSFLVPDANLVLTTGSFGQILGTTASTSRKIQFMAKFNF